MEDPKPKPTIASDIINRRYKINFSRIANLLVALVVGFAGGFLAVKFYGSDADQLINSNENRQQIVLKESEVISEIVKEVGPSVVSINVVTQARSSFWYNQYYSQESAGTGIIVSKDGLVLTNKHVISGSPSSLQVVLSDGTTYDDIEIIDEDPLNDIAFLKINGAKDLSPASLGDSDAMKVGDKVIAIGNALGQFENTVTSGIISGIGRPIVASEGNSAEQLQDLFQTDAAINPGNSGGPLVNINGEVIGVNTAVAGNAENIGFAIPINDVKSALSSVIEDGEIIRPYLGVRYIMLSDSIAEELEIDQTEGAYIVKDNNQQGIIPDSPADKAGLKEGDVITKINDDAINNEKSIVSIISKYKVGDVINITIDRNGEVITLKTTLETAPSDL